MIDLPTTIFYVGDAYRGTEFARRNKLGYGMHRIKDRPFVRIVSGREDIHKIQGVSPDFAVMLYDDAWCRWMYEEGGEKKDTLRMIQEIAYRREFRTLEQWIFGVY